MAFLYFQKNRNQEKELETVQKIKDEERLLLLSEDFGEIKKELAQKTDKIIELSSKLASKESQIEAFKEKIDLQKQNLQDLQSQFSKEFENLANRILEEKSEKFTLKNKQNISEILLPLQEKIKEFEQKVEQTYDKESKQRFSLEKELKNLMELNQQLSQDANNLTNALKGQVKTQGNWGEMILESILEKSGLTKNREYFPQKSLRNNEGKLFQPDVIIAYPDGKNVIVDSKVSLNAYEKYCNSEEKLEQKLALQDHLQSIKQHILGLSQKNYQDLEGVQSLDFVMMFIPIEAAYMTAVQVEPDLWNFAYQKRILLISPTNLIVALKMIADLWRQEMQNQNSIEIAQKSGALYDKFVLLLEDLAEIGKKIDSTQLIYQQAISKLHSGKGNLIGKVENLRELGAKIKKKLPSVWVEKSLQDSE